MDGINLGRPAAARVAFFDLETLDVKRGPQGLLGGKNSTSGSINLITKKPTDEYEVSGDVLLRATTTACGCAGTVNVPFGEFAAARLALYHEDARRLPRQPLVSDSHDPFDADDFGLRGHLKLTSDRALELLFSYNYFKQDGNGPQADVVPIPAGQPVCAGHPPPVSTSQSARPPATLRGGRCPRSAHRRCS